MSRLRLTSAPHYTPPLALVLSFCLLLAAVPACGYTAVESYFPLADSATWEYSGKLTGSDGRQLDFHSAIRVEGQTIIRGRKYYKLVTSTDLPAPPGGIKPSPAVHYYRVADDGVYALPGSDIGGPELLEMPLPLTAGTKWLSGPTEVKAESAGAVSAGGRDYKDCLKITYGAPDGFRSMENYLAPGVGIVKAVHVSTAGPKFSMEMALDRYRF
jgi:hypothetical protein